jgi:hypothetical protein
MEQSLRRILGASEGFQNSGRGWKRMKENTPTEAVKCKSTVGREDKMQILAERKRA